MKKKKQSKTAQRRIRCPVCGGVGILRPASEIYGDPAYDWVKLYYSIAGNYDQFNLKRFRLEINDQDVLLELGLVTYTDDDEVLLISFGNTYDHVADQLSHETVIGSCCLLVVLSGDYDLSFLEFNFDCRTDLLRQFALRSFNGDDSVSDGSLDRLRHINR